MQWQDQQPQTIVVTFPGQGQNAQFSSASGISASLPQDKTNYVFDCIVLAEHEQDLTKTRHPVQTGAAISDHAFIENARLILDVGMSDAMDAYYSPTTWDISASPSKSVSAYQTMLALQFSRVPLSIQTRLRTYQNMIITGITPTETARTVQGLRMRISFEQIFIATITQIEVSARPQDTGETNLGLKTPIPPSDSQQSQNGMTGISGLPVYPSNVPGSGTWSSVNTQNLSALVPKQPPLGGGGGSGF